MYTTIDRVRTLSGFDDTTNITDSNIVSKIWIAGSYIDSAVGSVYSLPFAFRYKNTIDFSGTGAWSGTMAIVVNGTTYNVSIALSDTASMVADKFRVASASSTDFLVDDLGNGSQVYIISRTNSDTQATAYAEVNITSVPTTQGISGTIGTRIKRYPQILEQITAEIATALLFIDIYGVESQDTGKDGKTRMDSINEMLQKLQGVHDSGQTIRIYDEVTQTEVTQQSEVNISSYPNDTSDDDDDDPTSPKVFINQTF